MQTVLVTGGAGFIGGNYVLRSLAENPGLRIVNLDALTYAGNLDTLAGLQGSDRHVFRHGSIADQSQVARLLEEFEPNAIVNFAAESHVDRSIDGPADFIQTNIVGTFNLLQCTLDWWKTRPEAEQQAFRFLHVSTDEVYGSLGDTGLFEETTAYAPNSPYAASKASSDHLVRAWFHTFGLPVLTTNCSNNYGPHQFPEKLIPLMILNALNNKPLPVYGKGLNVRDWLFVRDHCSAVWTILQNGRSGETYNVGGHTEKRNIEVVETVCDLLDDMAVEQRPPGIGGYRELITFVEDRAGHDWRYAIDAAKALFERGNLLQKNFRLGIRPYELVDRCRASVDDGIATLVLHEHA